MLSDLFHIWVAFWVTASAGALIFIAVAAIEGATKLQEIAKMMDEALTRPR